MIFLYYILLFIILLANQSHYIFGGDSAEFSLVARTFSVAHPPGYPFYSVLSRVFNFIIPFGTTPWKISLISSIATIITSYILFKILTYLKIPRLIAIFSTTLYIFLFPIWQYAEIPEVFALHNLIVMYITYLLFRYPEKNNINILYFVAFLVGLNISHHHIFILFIPGWLYLLKSKWSILLKRQFKKKALLISFLAFALGTSFYGYSVIASRFAPPLDWENAGTFEGFIRLITRSSYGVFKAYSSSSGNIMNQLFDSLSFFIFALHDFRTIGLFLALIGCIFLYKKNKQAFLFFGMTLLLHLFFLFYTNFSLSGSFTIAMYERFLIPIYMLTIIPFSFGVSFVLQYMNQYSHKWIHNTNLRRIVLGGYYLFLISYLFIIFFQNYQVMRKIPRLNYFDTYAKDLLDTVPKDAIFFVGADNSYFTTVYKHYAEGYRNDVKFIFINIFDKRHYRDQIRIKYPELFVPEPYEKGRGLSTFIERNKKFGIYFDNPFGNLWKPYGLLWKYYGSETESQADKDNLLKMNDVLWNHTYTIPRLDSELKKILHLNVVQDHYVNSYINYSKLLFASGQIVPSEMVIKKIVEDYRSHDEKTKLILINILVHESKCSEAHEYVKSMVFDTIYADSTLLPSLKNYYLKCDKNNKTLLKIDQIMDKNIKSSKKSLKEF